jgi:hypothetical protein
MVTLMPQPLHVQTKTYSLNRMLAGPQIRLKPRLNVVKKKKSLPLPGI